MTPKQQECLDFIKAYIEQHKMSPTFGEIAEHFGLKSKEGVHRLLTALERDGFIMRTPYRTRGITVLDDPWVAVGVAAAKVVASVRSENIDANGNGTITVDAAAFGDLDIALSSIGEAAKHVLCSAALTGCGE